MKQPLLRVALFYVAGILTASYFTFPLPGLLAFALGLVLLAILWPRMLLLLLATLLFLFGAGNFIYHTSPLSSDDLRYLLKPEPQLVTVRGKLIETPTMRVYEQGDKPQWRTLARVEVSGLQLEGKPWQPAHGRLAVTTRDALTNLFGGQGVEVAGVAAWPKGPIAEGTFDYRAYLNLQDIYFLLQVESASDWTLLGPSVVPPLADRFRDWARKALARGLPIEDESLRLEWALALGWKPALTEEVSEPFVQAATYHIFAVDGLRMAIIFGIFFGLFRAAGVPRNIAGIILLPLIWFYVALTGWPASAIRATVMLTVVVAGWALKRPVSLLNSLFYAACLILVWEPQQLFQAGFQLSFLVVLCLLLMLPPCFLRLRQVLDGDPLLPARLRRRCPPVLAVPGKYAADILLTSFAAWVGSIPLVAYYFHIITPVSTPANLVAVPLCGLVLVSNLASLLLTGWLPAAAELFNHAGWFLMECIRVTSHWFAAWPAAYFYLPQPSLFTSCLYYGLLLGLVTGWLLQNRWRFWKLATVGVLSLLWLALCWREMSACRLTVLPANAGMAIHWKAPGAGNDVLVDTGNTNALQFVVKPFLRAQGVNSLATLVLTHGDLQHVGGAEMATVLFPAKHVCASPVRFRSSAYRRTLERFKNVPGLLQLLHRDERLGIWTILHPDVADRFPKADDGALALRADIAGTRILLLSDLGRAGQAALLERTEDLRADIVVTGLPTDGEALGDALLDAAHPHAIIVADSEFPSAARAREPFQQRLARRNIPVFYTRSSGAATVEFSGGRADLHTMAGEKMTLTNGYPAKFLLSFKIGNAKVYQSQ